MSFVFIMAWTAAMFPLVFSPGPANVAFAASGASFGIKRSLPLMFGIETIFFIQSLLIGFGVNELLEKNQNFLMYLQLVGAGYLLYLAYTFIKPTLQNNTIVIKELGYKDGLFIQFFNIKALMLILLMFSLFSNTLVYEIRAVNILILCFMLAFLNIIAHVFWISSSSFLFKKLLKNAKLQAYIFASSLFFVAISFIYDSNVFRS